MKTCRPKPMLILVGAIACLALLMICFWPPERSALRPPVVQKLYWRIWVTLPEPTHRFLPRPKFPPFARMIPPILGADPSARHHVSFQMPTKLKIQRTADVLSVAVDLAATESVNLMVGRKMVTGVESQLYVSEESKSGHADRQLRRSSSATDFNLGTAFLNAQQDGLPIPGRRYIVEMDLAVFETDIPPQHMWEPRGGKFTVLWHRTLKQVVE